MNVSKTKTVNLVFSIFILFGVASTIIDPLIPVISEKLKIGYDKIGLILLVGSIIGFISVFISGRLCDKYNLKKIILIGLISSALGLALFVVYLSFIVFILLVILIRLGHGILDSSIHTYMFKITGGKKSSIFIKLDSFWYIGAILGPLLISLALFLKIDSKFVFAFFSISYLVLMFLFFKISPDSNSGNIEENLKNNLKVGGITKITDIDYESESSGNNKIKILTLFKNPIIFCTFLIVFFNIGIIANLSTWLTTYFTAFKIPLSFSSMILSFFWIFSTIGLIIVNKTINRINELKTLILFTLLGTICTIFYSLIPFAIIKFIFLFLQAIFYSGICPLTISMAAVESPEASGTIIGICLAAGSSSSIILLPLIGHLTQYYGKEYIAYVILLIAILGLIFVFILFMLFNKKHKSKFEVF